MPSYYRQPPPPLPPASSLPFPGNLVRQCSDCDLRAGCQAPVPGNGPVPAYVMLVGQNPGRQEDEWGKPFVGTAGRQLDSLLMQAGVSRETVYITNLIRCLTPNNAAPKPVHIKACAKWLNLELDLVNPRIIVAMGAPAISRFLGSDAGSVEHLHGKPVAIKVGSSVRTVLPCYHPAAAIHNTSLLRQVADDFQVLRGLVSGHELSDYIVADEYPDPVYRIADTSKKRSMMLEEVRSVGECAVDVETIKRDTELWSVQVSAIPGTAWFVPVKSGHVGRVDTIGWNSHILVHNYLHDVQWLTIPDRNFRDTMVKSYLIGLPQGLKELASRLCGIRMQTYSEMVRPGQRKLSVQYLTEAVKREWSDPPPIEEVKWDNKAGKIITRIKHPKHISTKIRRILADCVDSLDVDPYERWRNIPELEREAVEKALGQMPESSLADIKFEDAMEYACRDAQATLRVSHKMDKLITDLGLDFVLHMDTAILPMVYEMMRTGWAVDLDHFRALSTEYRDRMADKAEELSRIVGHSFNPNSRLQVAKVVYEELGFKPTALTPSREVSTDDQELKKVKHLVTRGIIEYRRLSKVKGTYADALTELAIPDPETNTTRIHTTLKTTRVGTGRLSSADPNLQNVPVRSKEGKKIRLGFIASPGMRLGEGDLAQVEMVTQAHLARCKGLIELFLRGGDPHTETAAKIFGVSLEEAAQEKYRYPTKRANFGVVYMIGAQGLANQIQEYIADLEMEGSPVDIAPWDERTCEKFIADWYKLYPEVRDYQLEMASQARRMGYVSDLFGRIRYIPEVHSPIRSVSEAGLRMAANMPVTASAQGIIKLAMGELYRDIGKTGWRDDVRFLMQIHDSLVVEMTDDEEIWKPYLSWMGKVMTGVVKLLVPVKVDFKTGHRWGDMEKVKL